MMCSSVSGKYLNFDIQADRLESDRKNGSKEIREEGRDFIS